MKVVLTLSEVLDKCNDWEMFCDVKGYSTYAVNEGGGDLVISLSENEAKKFGIIKE